MTEPAHPEQTVPFRRSPGPGLAFALGGGVARGWAHIGVMRAVDEAGLPVSMIAGTSIGALVGGAYMAGRLDELEEFALGLTQRRLLGFLDVSFRGAGLIAGEKLAGAMEEHLSGLRLETLPRGVMVAVAAEITTGHEIWLSTGDVTEAIRASYALPGIFEPVEIAGRVLVDGAVVNPVPVSVCRAYESRVVVAVNLASEMFGRAAVVRSFDRDRKLEVSPGSALVVPARTIWKKMFGSREKQIGITGVLMETFNIVQDRITRSRMAGDPPDLTLRPPVEEIGLTDFHRAREAIEVGYRSTMAQMDRLEAAAKVA